MDLTWELFVIVIYIPTLTRLAKYRLRVCRIEEVTDRSRPCLHTSALTRKLAESFIFLIFSRDPNQAIMSNEEDYEEETHVSRRVQKPDDGKSVLSLPRYF
jgi:hypothetical protein